MKRSPWMSKASPIALSTIAGHFFWLIVETTPTASAPLNSTRQERARTVRRYPEEIRRACDIDDSIAVDGHPIWRVNRGCRPNTGCVLVRAASREPTRLACCTQKSNLQRQLN